MHAVLTYTKESLMENPHQDRLTKLKLDHEFNRIEFGERLQAMRREAQVLQVDIAEYLGVARSQISQYESGLHLPKLPTLTRMIQYYWRKGARNFELNHLLMGHEFGLWQMRGTGGNQSKILEEKDKTIEQLRELVRTATDMLNK